jgi:hypothetical protein
MRRYAHCLILLTMPFAASATAALDDSRGACVLQRRCRLAACTDRDRFGRHHQAGTGPPGSQHQHGRRWQR